MAKAVCNGTRIAETGDIAHVEGNAYFPLQSIDPALSIKISGDKMRPASEFILAHMRVACVLGVSD